MPYVAELINHIRDRICESAYLVCGKPMHPVVTRALPRAWVKREKTLTS